MENLIFGIVLLGLPTICVSALTLGFTALFTGNSSQRLELTATAVPFGCLTWIVCVYIVQTPIQVSVFHCDAGVVLGLGGTTHCRLANGFELVNGLNGFRGYIRNPRDQDNKRHGLVLADVGDVQVAGRYIFGERWLIDPQGFTNLAFFEVDTTTGVIDSFANYEAAAKTAWELGTKLNLRPFSEVYRENRAVWFDQLVMLIALFPPLLVYARLIRVVLRVAGSTQ